MNFWDRFFSRNTPEAIAKREAARAAAEQQPPPRPGREVVADYVLADIQARVEAGEAKYGTKLMTYNGRDPLWDAYQEAIDLVMYLRQAILEREHAQGS